MHTDVILLYIVGASFVGFIIGLWGRNRAQSRQKSMDAGKFFGYLTAISASTLIIGAVLYSILA